MGNLKAFIEEHRKGAAIAFILLLLFVSGSAISAFRVAQDRAQEAAQAEGSAQGQDPEGNNAPQEDVELTESQREAIAGYDDDTRAFIETLSASVWSAGNGRYTLRFSDDSYVETVDGEAVTHSYAIERIDRESDGYGGTIATIVFESDTGVHVATYTDGKGAAVQPGSGGGQADSTVIASLTSASMFAAKDTPYPDGVAIQEHPCENQHAAQNRLTFRLRLHGHRPSFPSVWLATIILSYKAIFIEWQSTTWNAHNPVASSST